MQQWSEMMNGRAFITDLGENRMSVIGGKEVTVGRYAVWSPMRNGDGHSVVEVGESLDELQQKYGIPADRICRCSARQ